MGIKHTKISALTDSGSAGLIQPSDWNDEHIFDPTGNPLQRFRRKQGSTVEYEFADPTLDNCLDYDFAAQTIAQSLTGGVGASITISPVPLGVNGSNSGHYLQIVDWVAGNEIVLITGGTATSGSSSGTLTFTPALSHASGNWSIKSATTGIQEILIQAASARGVATLKPKSGGYSLYGPITMPPYTSLVGIGEGCHRSQFHYGTSDDSFKQQYGVTLSCYWNHGSSSGAQITMGTGSVIANLNFNYPNQSATNVPVVYPPTIKIDAVSGIHPDHCKIYEVFFVNAYHAIEAEVSHSRMHVKGAYGCPIHRGITISGASDSDLIEDILFKGLYHTDNGYGAYDPNRLSGYTIANGRAIVIDLADGIRLSHVYIFGYQMGVNLTKTGERGSYGSFTSVWTDSTKFGLYVENDGISNTITCSGCAFTGHDGINPNAWGVYVTDSPTGILQLTGSMVGCTVATGQNAIWANSGTILFTGGWVSTWGFGGGAAACFQLEGTANLQLCNVFINGNFGGIPSGTPTITFNNFTGTPPRFIGVINVRAFVIVAAAGNTPDVEFIGCHDVNGPYEVTKTQAVYKGTAIASAATIAITKSLHHITGTTAIDTITNPAWIKDGSRITLIPDAIWTMSTAGNIAKAVTAVVGRPLDLIWDSTTTKWYPSY